MNAFNDFFKDVYQDQYIQTSFSSTYNYVVWYFQMLELKDKNGNDIDYLFNTTGGHQDSFPITLTKNVGTDEERSFTFRPYSNNARMTIDFFTSIEFKHVDLNIYAIPNEEDMD